MNISITFRQLEASESIKRHATEKLGKLQKFLRRPMTARVTLSLEKLEHVADTRISSGGQRYEAREATDDMYTAIDRVTDKLERQIRGTKGAAQAKKRRTGETLRAGRRPTAAAEADGTTTKRKAAGGKKKTTARPAAAKRRAVGA